MISVRVIDDPGQLAGHRDEWSSLLERSASNGPTLSPSWLLNWWRVFGNDDGRSLRTGLIRDGDELVGIAPLLRRWHWYRPGIPFRRLEFLASGEAEADETCSDYLSLIAAPGREQEVSRNFVEALANGAFGEWDELMLPAMAGDSPFVSLLQTDLAQHGIRVEVIPKAVCPYVTLPQSWDGYLAMLSSSHRYNLRRGLRDFEKWAGPSARFRIARSNDEVFAAFDTLRELHAERWQADGAHGVFESQRFVDFHRSLLPELHRENALELSILEAHDRPVAALYNIVHGGKVHFYQSGRAVDVPKNVRPGTVAHAYAIRHSIDLGRREYDFLAGASRYKLELASETRQLVSLRAIRSSLVPSIVEQCRSLAHQAAATRPGRLLRSLLEPKPSQENRAEAS